jgi:hypothetical protein
MKAGEFFVYLTVCLAVAGVLIYLFICYFEERKTKKAIEDTKPKGPLGFSPSPSST